MSDETSAELARELIGAINRREFERLRSLLADEVEVVTGRSVHAGPDAVVAWAAKTFEHLERHYAIDEIRRREGEGALLALGAVQYVWSEDGEVADSSPVALEILIEAGRLRLLRLHDDTAAALAEFEA